MTEFKLSIIKSIAIRNGSHKSFSVSQKKKKKKKKHLPTDRVSQTLFNFIQTNNEVMLTVDESS